MNTTTFSNENAAHFSTDTVAAARTRQGDHCARCGVSLATVTSFAHALEKQEPPRDEVGNCFVLCVTCDYLGDSLTGHGAGSVESRSLYAYWESGRGGSARGARSTATGTVIGGHRRR